MSEINSRSECSTAVAATANIDRLPGKRGTSDTILFEEAGLAGRVMECRELFRSGWGICRPYIRNSVAVKAGSAAGPGHMHGMTPW